MTARSNWCRSRALRASSTIAVTAMLKPPWPREARRASAQHPFDRLAQLRVQVPRPRRVTLWRSDVHDNDAATSAR
jgi:hypothetical protein